MKIDYIFSNITEYNEELSTINVKLPLKYEENYENVNFNEKFKKQCSIKSNIIEIHEQDVEHVLIKLLSNKKTIILMPLNINYESEQKLHNIKIEFPDKINPKCLSFFFEKQEKILILDIIDANNFFISIKITLKDFLNNPNEDISFLLDNFQCWGTILNPYIYNFNSKAHFLRHIDSLNLLVSFRNGETFHLKRENILGIFEIKLFNECSSISMNFLSDFFKKKYTKKNNTILSPNSIVDLELINPHTIICLTVSKVFKMWNLKTHTLIDHHINLNEKLKSWITYTSVKHFQIVNDVQNKIKYLAFYHNIENNFHSEIFKFEFKICEIREFDDFVDLIPLDLFFFQPNLLNLKFNNKDIVIQNNNWIIQDFQVVIEGNNFSFFILWKTNVLFIVTRSDIDIQSGKIVSELISNFTNLISSNDFLPYRNIEYYVNKVLNSGDYTNSIIDTSMLIFTSHIGIDIDDFSSRQKIISEVVNYLSSLDIHQSKKNWFKIYSLCEEFKKLSEECLCLNLINKDSLIVLQADSLSISRPLHYFESICYNTESDSKKKLISIFNDFNKTLSVKSFYKLHQSLKTVNTLNKENMTSFFCEYLDSKMSSEFIQSLVEKTTQSADFMNLINTIVDPIMKIDNDHEEEKNLTKFLKIKSLVSFKAIKSVHEYLLLNIVILCLICEVDIKIIALINKIVSSLKTYDTYSFIFDFKLLLNEEEFNLKDKNNEFIKNQLFWNTIVYKLKPIKKLISNGDLNQAYNEFYYYITVNHDLFIIDITISLINSKNKKFFKQEFLNKINNDNIFNKFLIGIAYLLKNDSDNFFKVFQDFTHTDFENLNQLKKLSSLINDEVLKKFLKSIYTIENDFFIVKSNYYHVLSKLLSYFSNFGSENILNSESNFILSNDDHTNNLNKAIDFEFNAIKILKLVKNQDTEITEKLNQYYYNIFEKSLSLSNYDLVYKSLSSFSNQYQNYYDDYKDLVKKFIVNLVKNKKINILFNKNHKFLCAKNFLLIDKILLDLANNQKNLLKSRIHYEYLYSWRLFGCSSSLESNLLSNIRGAAEALYMFIKRYEIEGINFESNSITSTDEKNLKLKILEFYMIISNCLKSFEENDDKWIIKYNDTYGSSIVKIDELSFEYYNHLNELNNKLKD